jgi:hypothetical protein
LKIGKQFGFGFVELADGCAVTIGSTLDCHDSPQPSILIDVSKFWVSRGMNGKIATCQHDFAPG